MTATWLLTGDHLITGADDPPIRDGAIVIRDGRIAWFGPKAEIAPPEDQTIKRVDYPGASILPGLVDVHTHLSMPGDGSPGEAVAAERDELLVLQAARNARLVLASGVTTARENGAKNHVALALRDGIARGLAQGPRLVVCGRPLTITGGHMWYFGSEVDGPESVRQGVRQLVKDGADYIKIAATGGSTVTSLRYRPSFSLDEIAAIVDEAHKLGMLVAAHCSSSEGIRNSLRAHVDMVIHSYFYEPDGKYVYQPEIVEELCRSRTWVNPTLYIAQAGIRRLERKAREQPLTQPEVAKLEQFKRGFDSRMDATSRMIAAGVQLVAGSDSAWGSFAPGQFVSEVETLASAGLSNIRAIAAATSLAAESIGLGDYAGRLREGQQADLLVVKGNAAADVRVLWNVIDVYQGGEPVSKG